jgi:low temperature requirement protein LtrA
MSALDAPRTEPVGRPAQRRLRLRTSVEEEGRSTSPLELFFDLVFAVGMAELVAVLLHQPSWGGAARFAALFIPVWWTWVCYTFYADRFDNDDRLYRLVMIVAMTAALSLAVMVPGAFADRGGAVRFALSYLVVRLILIGLYLRAHHHAVEARPLTRRYLQGFAAGATCWAAAALVPPPASYVLWALGLGLEMATPLVSAAAISRVPFNRSHIPERFGLFTIIVLGEVVALNAAGIATSHLRPAALATVFGSLLVGAAQWWLCFDYVDDTPLRQWRLTGQVYVYGHLVVHAGIAATGVGGLLATEAANSALAGTAWRPVLCLGIAAFLLGIGAIHLVNVRPPGDLRAWSRIGLGALLAVLALVGPPLPPVGMEVVLLVCLAAQITVEGKVPDVHTILARSGGRTHG